MNMKQLRDYVALQKTKRNLEAQLKEVVEQLDHVEQHLVPQFLEDGVRSMQVDGHVVYLAQDIYAAPARDRAEVVAALKASGLGQYVSEDYRPQSLKAYIREIAQDVRARCEDAGAFFDEAAVSSELPQQLASALRITFSHSLRLRKA